MTEKRKYEKPSMRVYKLQQRQQLLQNSGGNGGGMPGGQPAQPF